mgnify:CR=1 FL=1
MPSEVQAVLETLKTAKHVVGIKQLRKALREGAAETVFVAEDADLHLTDPVREACAQAAIPVVSVPTMDELGKACAIEVGAAVAAIIR